MPSGWWSTWPVADPPGDGIHVTPLLTPVVAREETGAAGSGGRWSPRCLVPVVVCVVVSGCDPGDAPPPSGDVIVQDSAGVRMVTSPAPTWTPGAAWTVDPDPRLTVGALDGPEEAILHGVRDATVLPDGGVAVVNGGSGDVRLYDAGGRYRGTLGRSGDGPGEFARPAQVYPGGGDTVVVWDNTRRLVHWFGPDGALVRVVAHSRTPPPTQGRLVVPVAAWLLPDYDVVVDLRELDAGAEPSEELRRPRHWAVRSSPDRPEPDTVAAFPGREAVTVRVPPPAGLEGVGTVTREVAPLYARTTAIGFGDVPSRVCIGTQEQTEISCFDADGSRTRIRWTAATVPVGADEVQAWRHGMADASLVDRIPIPETRPPHGAILVDDLGHLWVEVPGPSDGEGEPTEWRVFDREGVWLGQVTLPAMRVLEIGEQHIVGLCTDELDVEYVQVHTLER